MGIDRGNYVITNMAASMLDRASIITVVSCLSHSYFTVISTVITFVLNEF